MADTTANVAADDGGDPQVTFKVKTSGDRNHTITMAESATVLDLKQKLAGEDLENIPVEHQRLIYSGRVMKNTDLLSVYKIKDGNTVHLVKSAASNRASAAAGTSSTSASGAPATPAVPTNMAAGTSASNLLEGLTGARFAGLAPLPNPDIFGPDGGMAPPPSEEQLADLLSQPGMAASMNEALSNPAMIDYIIQSNPMLRNMPNAREMVQSPQFRQMMTDPESIRMAARLRRMMGGSPGEASAFPAPGATDNTADSARSTNQPAEGGFPLFDPAMLARMSGGAGGNPFAALFGPQATQSPGSTSATNPASGTQGTGDTAGAGGPTPNNPFGMNPEILRQIMGMAGAPGAGGLGAGGLGNMFGMGAPSPPDNRPPEERYAEQLRQLNDMGFYDFDSNVAALRRSGGSVQGAIEHLLNSS
ncbi:hypothetical protein MCOR27_008949 [Pyricularia oryzae]|uniref:Deubiquitination-protection protein dph1 n=5 Tax=Pyricularia TaxID=48558 RepID=A0ABQ8NIQ2_PYRGI|nr:deubiquitination-protection protein dph1 [Pyricularia oryzae 70-15]ELQ44078.1 deubiquitination-protection protein dph1 [Pyricularia oryzae Y34]KAH8836856.1 hypothetical protein MCOR01_010516 [Pyricularia oryzae]KAI6297708.1 hypothetical protein MCOR33_006035 [Pyricularia grisea]EHA54436.1 deubiquitination-protection protein dph1 [Pyricularia oryzae 70-15]KAH9438495.1 hypothetical protein MCOR02_002114 [Pyricularia oryzae]